MKANFETSLFQLNGEEGRRLVVVFYETDGDVSARILFNDGYDNGREVELDSDELARLQGVLATDADTIRKQGASLSLEEGELVFTVHSSNRGEPYRDGFDFNLERGWDGYPFFIETNECRDFARVIGRALGKKSPSPR
jgi:hypothetical protein